MTLFIRTASDETGGVGYGGVGKVPAEKKQVVGAVCFFQDDDDAVCVGAVDVVAQLEGCEVGCGSIGVIGTI